MEKKKKNRKILEELDQPTKFDNTIARYLKFNIPSKKGNMFGSKVQYFTGSKAVDVLLASKWGLNKSKSPIPLNTREACLDYLNLLIIKNFFHRVKKIVKIVDYKDEKDISDSKKLTKRSNHQDKKEQTVKKKIKLELHEIQTFVAEGDDQFYVWIYDPIPLKTWILGFSIVIGAIIICLFPLWPASMRSGVYYLSLAGAGFLGFIIILALLRYIIFGIVWAGTLGKHHIWFFPNLLEDVGFFESFVPIYTHKCPSLKQHSNSAKKKTPKKDAASTEADKDKRLLSEENTKLIDEEPNGKIDETTK